MTKNLLVPDIRQRLNSHEVNDIVFDFHEIDDESDPNPKQKNCRDVESRNNEPECQKSRSTRSLAQNDNDVGKYDGNDPEKTVPAG